MKTQGGYTNTMKMTRIKKTRTKAELQADLDAKNKELNESLARCNQVRQDLIQAEDLNHHLKQTHARSFRGWLEKHDPFEYVIGLIVLGMIAFLATGLCFAVKKSMNESCSSICVPHPIVAPATAPVPVDLPDAP